MKNIKGLLPVVILVCIVFVTIQARVIPVKPVENNDQKEKNATNDSLQKASMSLTSAVERQLTYIEDHIVSAAEAMPEDKYYFTPESLNIQGSAFKDVRTFAGQIKHLATDNYDMWSAIIGDPLPAGIVDVNGPADIKSKDDILNYLKGSFAEGHKAIANLTADNAMDMLDFRGGKLARLDLVFYALTHSNDHYGQMVVYLRMCGILPGMNLHNN
ncbi:MAG TPA: DinB family protein [Panacibacter sp.]|nr:DinB family protein [Panacibacter sp.]